MCRQVILRKMGKLRNEDPFFKTRLEEFANDFIT